MKKWGMIVLIGCLFVVPSLVQAQAQADKTLGAVFGQRGIEDSSRRPESSSTGDLSGPCSAGTAGGFPGNNFK